MNKSIKIKGLLPNKFEAEISLSAQDLAGQISGLDVPELIKLWGYDIEKLKSSPKQEELREAITNIISNNCSRPGFDEYTRSADQILSLISKPTMGEEEAVKILEDNSDLFLKVVKGKTLINYYELVKILFGKISKPQEYCECADFIETSEYDFKCKHCHRPKKTDVELGYCHKPNEEIESLIYDKLDIVRIDPEKRQFVQTIQIAINYLREKTDELIKVVNGRKWK